jgi:hypothetical protein
MMKMSGIACAAALVLAAGCGKKDGGGGGGGIPTAEAEYPFGDVVVKGKLPTWDKSGSGGYALTETVDGLAGVTVAAINFDSFGGTGIDRAQMRSRIDAQKAEHLDLEIAGAKPAVVQDLAETSPGIWTYVTKAPDWSGQGDEYNVFTFHMPKDDAGVMYGCHGRSRLTRASLWKGVLDICTKVAFVGK